MGNWDYQEVFLKICLLMQTYLKKIFFILAFMVLPILGEPIAIFEKPQRDARVLIADKELFKETGKVTRQIINNHPLGYVHYFHEVKGPNNLIGYYRPDVVVKEDGKSLKIPPIHKEKTTFKVWI